MSYVNPFIYSRHIPNLEQFLDGNLMVQDSMDTMKNFGELTPEDAMKWIRKYNLSVAQERRDFSADEQDLVVQPRVFWNEDALRGQVLDLADQDNDNYVWELSKSKVAQVHFDRGHAVVAPSTGKDAVDVLMTRVEQLNGQQFIEATVDLEKWTGTLKVGENNFTLEYGFNEWQVAQRSLSFEVLPESLAQYLGRDITTNPGILLYEAATRLCDDVFPGNLVVRSGQSGGGQKFRKLFQRSDVKFTKREDVGVIDGQDDLVARAQIDVSSSEISQFAEQSIIEINLREKPSLDLAGEGTKDYFIEIRIQRPDTDQFDSHFQVQGQLRNWLSALWRGDRFVSNLGLEDILNVQGPARMRLPRVAEINNEDDIHQRITIEEIFKKAS